MSIKLVTCRCLQQASIEQAVIDIGVLFLVLKVKALFLVVDPQLVKDPLTLYICMCGLLFISHSVF